MNKIASFTVDHTRLKRGIYVSRKDRTSNGDVLTTLDIRMTEPNRQEALSPRALHAIEHLAATFLRNHPVWGDKIIYWGPMGCCTGNYLIVSGDYQSKDMVDLVKETMRFIAGFEGKLPGASPEECGNYTFMDVEGAREAARKFSTEILDNLTDDNLVYPC